MLAKRTLRLVKGSHIIVPRCFEHDHAYLFQNPDRRIIFAIPYEQRFTLIGTTDVEVQGEPGEARVERDEIEYLCRQASSYFRRPIEPAAVVSSYCGVRPLLDDESGDPSAVTRDYLLEHDAGAAPLLSVWGGKITTFRRLAEDAAAEVGRMLGKPGRAWTHDARLPGGDLSAWIGGARRPDVDFDRFVDALRQRHGWLPDPLVHRLARAYGGRIDRVLGDAKSLREMGGEVAPGLYERELHYLRGDEWAHTAADVLWRRSKLGLHYTADERARVDAWMSQPSHAAQGVMA